MLRVALAVGVCSAWGPELPPGSRSGAVPASAMCLCGGDRSWPRQLPAPGSAGERVASLDVHLWLGRARGPILLVCTTASPLPSVPPHRAARRLCSLPGSAPGSRNARRVPGSSTMPRRAPGGAPQPARPHAPVSALALLADSIRPRGTWPDLSHVPLQLQPLLSKFLCLMQGGEATRVSKGKSPRGAELLGGRQALPGAPG